MASEKGFFRQVMGHFSTGVTIVTTTSQGKVAGLTVSSFTSLSLDPPLVLICVGSASTMLQLFCESKIFAVNVLTAKQVQLSRCFAMPSEDRFEHFCHAPYRLAATGAPIFDDVLAFVDTRLVAQYPGGDHVILVGQVEAMGTAGRVVFASKEGEARCGILDSPEYAVPNGNGRIPLEDPTPLAYYRGHYRHLAPDYREPSLDRKCLSKNKLTRTLSSDQHDG